jgi:hypothetical protein
MFFFFFFHGIKATDLWPLGFFRCPSDKFLVIFWRSFCLFRLRTVSVTTTPNFHHSWKAHSESSSTTSKSKPSDLARAPTRRLKFLVRLTRRPAVARAIDLTLCHVSHSARDTSALAPAHRHLSPSCQLRHVSR